MAAFREALSNISTPTLPSDVKVTESEEEITKLKGLVTSLRDELSTFSVESLPYVLICVLAQARQSPNTLATQAQEVLDKFTTHASERLLTGRDPTSKEAPEMSMEYIGVLEQDELRKTLDKREMELRRERDQFTEATVKLGREKAALQVCCALYLTLR